MSARAPERVVDAAAACEEPAIVVDVDGFERRLAAVRAAAAAAGVSVLAAVKALGHPGLVARAIARLDGADVAGPAEDEAARGAPTISVTYPGGATAARLAALATPGRRVIASCETAAQVAAAAQVPGVEIALRISASALGEDAPGGVRDGAGGHASRFGVTADELRALAAVAPDRVRALHVHGGPLAIAPARLAARAAAAVAAAAASELAIARLDLGGSLHGFTLDEPVAGRARLADALAAVRAAVPAEIEVCVEPGRVLTEGVVYAAGRVLAVRTAAGHDARVLALSRLCHLRWSTPVLCAPPPRGDDRRALLLLGATCCEDDVIGDAIVPRGCALPEGALAIVAGVSGYAIAWNRGFAGVPAARVILV